MLPGRKSFKNRCFFHKKTVRTAAYAVEMLKTLLSWVQFLFSLVCGKHLATVELSRELKMHTENTYELLRPSLPDAI